MIADPIERLTEIRAHFPGITAEEAFFENAGGSLMPSFVIDAMTSFLRNSFVQIGGKFASSIRSTETYHAAHEFLKVLLNAGNTGEVILNASTSVNLKFLADAYGQTLSPGDRVIVSLNNHESNISPWLQLRSSGVQVDFWPVDEATGLLSRPALLNLLERPTKLVAYAQASNICGVVEPVKELNDIIRSAGAISVVDGVAYASHRSVDVQDLNCDWYVISCYKIYGPHLSGLFGTHSAMSGIEGFNHDIVPINAHPLKFELGCQSYEGCAGLIGLKKYFAFLAGTSAFDRTTVERAYETIEHLEEPLALSIFTQLSKVPSVRIIGPTEWSENHLGTISFVSSNNSSTEIANQCAQAGVAIKNGNMYAYRLLTALGLDPIDGVVRISLAHYNSPEEVDRLLRTLQPLI